MKVHHDCETGSWLCITTGVTGETWVNVLCLEELTQLLATDFSMAVVGPAPGVASTSDGPAAKPPNLPKVQARRQPVDGQESHSGERTGVSGHGARGVE